MRSFLFFRIIDRPLLIACLVAPTRNSRRSLVIAHRSRRENIEITAEDNGWKNSG